MALGLPFAFCPACNAFVIVADGRILVVQVEPAHRLVARHAFTVDVPAFCGESGKARAAGNLLTIFDDDKRPTRLVTIRSERTIHIDSYSLGFFGFLAVQPGFGLGPARKGFVLDALLPADQRFANIPGIYDLPPLGALDCIKLLLWHMPKFIYFTQTLE